MDRMNEVNAHILCEAIKKLAADEEKLRNFESYLTAHFHVWLLEYASTPDGMAEEFKQFSEMEW